MENKKVALITGITGQDGSYLAELLLEKGYEGSEIIVVDDGSSDQIDKIGANYYSANISVILIKNIKNYGKYRYRYSAIIDGKGLRRLGWKSFWNWVLRPKKLN